MKAEISRFLGKLLSSLWYFFEYYKSIKKLGNNQSDKEKFFEEFIGNSMNQNCLQIGARKKKIGDNWICVDLFDKSDYVDFNYDIHNLKFENNTFDYIVCKAVLEHVENPQQAISELYRVLKPDGKIWVEVPFYQPFHSSPNDFWRVSPYGLKIWMKNFKEIDSGVFKINRSSIYTGSYFYGKKG